MKTNETFVPGLAEAFAEQQLAEMKIRNGEKPTSPRKFEAEVKAMLLSFIKSDKEVYGKITKETREAIRVQGYRIKKGKLI